MHCPRAHVLFKSNSPNVIYFAIERTVIACPIVMHEYSMRMIVGTHNASQLRIQSAYDLSQWRHVIAFRAHAIALWSFRYIPHMKFIKIDYKTRRLGDNQSVAVRGRYDHIHTTRTQTQNTHLRTHTRVMQCSDHAYHRTTREALVVTSITPSVQTTLNCRRQ